VDGKSSSALTSAKGARPAKPSPSGFAGLMTTTRKPWYSPTEYLYLKLPCPSVHTSY
jgi:hypothetical protein